MRTGRSMVAASLLLALCCSPVTGQEPAEGEAAQQDQSVSIDVWYVKIPPGSGDSAAADGHVSTAARFESVEELAKHLQRLQARHELASVNHFHLVAASQAEARMQLSKRTPRVTAVNVTQRGRASTLNFENVGVQLRVRPVIRQEGRIAISMGLEESTLEDTDIPLFASADDGEAPTATQVISFQTEHEAILASGKPRVTFATEVEKDGSFGKRIVIVCVRPLDD